MLNALCTLFSYQFNFQKILVTIIVIYICYNIFNKKNLNFLYIINSMLMPILIVYIIFLSLNNINISEIELFNNNFFTSILSGILYFSYNSLLIIPILFELNITSKKNNLLLSLFFSMIIFTLTILINLLLLTFFEYFISFDLFFNKIIQYRF